MNIINKKDHDTTRRNRINYLLLPCGEEEGNGEEKSPRERYEPHPPSVYCVTKQNRQFEESEND